MHAGGEKPNGAFNDSFMDEKSFHAELAKIYPRRTEDNGTTAGPTDSTPMSDLNMPGADTLLAAPVYACLENIRECCIHVAFLCLLMWQPSYVNVNHAHSLLILPKIGFAVCFF
jgi:hypothetical protein